jgi:hypothetical protein
MSLLGQFLGKSQHCFIFQIFSFTNALKNHTPNKAVHNVKGPSEVTASTAACQVTQPPTHHKCHKLSVAQWPCISCEKDVHKHTSDWKMVGSIFIRIISWLLPDNMASHHKTQHSGLLCPSAAGEPDLKNTMWLSLTFRVMWLTKFYLLFYRVFRNKLANFCSMFSEVIWSKQCPIQYRSTEHLSSSLKCIINQSVASSHCCNNITF